MPAVEAGGEIGFRAGQLFHKRAVEPEDDALVRLFSVDKKRPVQLVWADEQQIARLRSLALDADLDPAFSEKFLRFIIDEVIRHHSRAGSGEA